MSKKKKIVSIILVLAAFVSLAFGSVVTFSSASGVDARGMIAVGERYLSEERYDEAVEVLSKAIDVEPKYVPAYVDRAAAYTALGDNEKAIADYETAIELEPEQEEELRPDLEALKPSETTTAPDNEENQSQSSSKAMPKKQVAASPTEDDLRAVLSNATENSIIYFYLADYDNDGKNEAFAISRYPKSMDSYVGGDVYFVNENEAKKIGSIETCLPGEYGGEKRVYDNNEGGNLVSTPDGYTFISIREGAPYGSADRVWGVKDGNVIEMNISTQYTTVYQNNTTGLIKAFAFSGVYDAEFATSDTKDRFYDLTFDPKTYTFSAVETDVQ